MYECTSTTARLLIPLSRSLCNKIEKRPNTKRDVIIKKIKWEQQFQCSTKMLGDIGHVTQFTTRLQSFKSSTPIFNEFVIPEDHFLALSCQVAAKL